jgi:hypothetical protein
MTHQLLISPNHYSLNEERTTSLDYTSTKVLEFFGDPEAEEHYLKSNLGLKRSLLSQIGSDPRLSQLATKRINEGTGTTGFTFPHSPSSIGSLKRSSIQSKKRIAPSPSQKRQQQIIENFAPNFGMDNDNTEDTYFQMQTIVNANK